MLIHSPQVILKCLASASVPAVSKFAAADGGSVQQVGAVLLSRVLGGPGAALTVTSLRHPIRVSRYIPRSLPTQVGRYIVDTTMIV